LLRGRLLRMGSRGGKLLGGRGEGEANRRAILATSADRLKALFEEYEKAGGNRGLLIDSVDASIRNPSGAVHSDISAPF